MTAPRPKPLPIQLVREKQGYYAMVFEGKRYRSRRRRTLLRRIATTYLKRELGT